MKEALLKDYSTFLMEIENVGAPCLQFCCELWSKIRVPDPIINTSARQKNKRRAQFQDAVLLFLSMFQRVYVYILPNGRSKIEAA